MNNIVQLTEKMVTFYQKCRLSIEIDHFFCHYKFQGKGVGRAMMEYIIEQAKQRGISRLYSEVSITARPFYERMGFTLVREQQVEMRGQ